MKRILSIFLLLLFIFPQAEQQLHALEHKDDVHCKELNEKHLHELEHTCTVCDYNVPASVVPATAFYQEIVFVIIPAHFTFVESTLLPNFNYKLPSRAPPALA